MKQRGLKILKWFLLSIVGLALLGLLSVNLYLQSEGSRSRLRQIIEGRFGSTAEIGSISYLPFRGLIIKRVKVLQRDDVAQVTEHPFLHIERISVDIDFSTLFSRPVYITEIKLERPVITIFQDVEGALALPWIKRGPIHPEILEVEPDIVADDPVVIPPPSPPAPVPPPARVPRFQLENIVMENGSLRLATANGRQFLADLTEIHANVAIPNDVKVSDRPILGHLSIGQTRLMKFFRASDLRSDIQLDAPYFAFPKIVGESDGGTVEATLLLNWSKAGIPFEFKSKLQNVKLDQLARRGSSRLGFSSGELEGELEAGGYLQAIESLRGSGKFEAVNARLSRNALLESLGRYLSLEEFVEVSFETAKTDFRLQGPRLEVQDLHVKTNNLEFRGRGAITLSQQVELAARLYFSQRMHQLLQRVERQLPEAMIRRVNQLEGRDDYYRDFMIGGTLEAPRADFIGGESRSFEELMHLMQGASEESPGETIP